MRNPLLLPPHDTTGVLDFVSHAVAWSAISRIVRHLPGGWLLIVLAIALVVMGVSRRRRRSR